MPAQIAILGVGGLDRDGLVEVGERADKVALFLEQAAAAAERCDRFRIEPYRRVEIGSAWSKSPFLRNAKARFW